MTQITEEQIAERVAIVRERFNSARLTPYFKAEPEEMAALFAAIDNAAGIAAGAPDVGALREALRKIYRGLEMSAAVMRDPARTGSWEGAERVAEAFERQAEAVKDIHAALASSPAAAEGAGDVAKAALEFAVLFLAFIGRDRGTNRLDRTLDGLIVKARELDALARAALSQPPAPAEVAEQPLTASQLADALRAFWNAAISAAHAREGSAAMDVASVMTEGFAAVAERLAPPAPAEGWRPIETAPKDGTMILAATRQGFVDIICWWPLAHTENDGAFRGDWDDGHRDEDGGFTPFDAVFWMPLPAAPEARS